MRKIACFSLLLCLAAAGDVRITAASPVQVAFGAGIRRLQDLVDRRYGEGRIDVRKDFIGARTDDIDPWFWIGVRSGAVYVRMLKRDRDVDAVGWYLEDPAGSCASRDCNRLFGGRPRPHEEALVVLPGTRARFGFFVESGARETLEEDDGLPSGTGRRFFTNRHLNGCGLGGRIGIQAPGGGQLQALIFDVSRWAGPDTWLVCFEGRDSGGSPGGFRIGVGAVEEELHEDDAGGRPSRGVKSDNDFDDAVFEVKAEGATPARAVSFGSVKLRYR